MASVLMYEIRTHEIQLRVQCRPQTFAIRDPRGFLSDSMAVGCPHRSGYGALALGEVPYVEHVGYALQRGNSPLTRETRLKVVRIPMSNVVALS